MPDCAACGLFQTEIETSGCLHVNRPGGIGLTLAALADCHLPANAAILDAACGAGGTLEYLAERAGYRMTGLDLSRSILTRNASGGNKVQATSLAIPLASGSMYAVLMECALSLAGGLHDLLAEFWRVLRPDGWLVLTDIYLREYRDPAARNKLSVSACLGGARPIAEMLQLIREARFEDPEWKDETPLFKTWLAGMVFRLGSLDAVYRGMTSCDKDCQSLSEILGKELKLGYYRMIARKTG